MKWSVAKARQNFSELIRESGESPQHIYNRDRLVAAVIDAATYQAFLEWQQQNQASINDIFAQLRELCAEEDYVLEIPERKDRENAFLADVSG